MTTWLGMRGTGNWDTDERPKEYRETLLRLYPNGQAPLTAILSKMGSEKAKDAEFNWWTKKFPEQSGAVTGVYTNAAMTAAYASGGAKGDTLYIKVAEATIAEFRVGHQVLLRDASDYTVDVNAKVIGRQVNGANSCLTVKLLEADDNSATHDLSDCDRIMVIGNINAEGAYMPQGLSYRPTKYSNYTQIFRTPLSITRTARETQGIRTGNTYKEMKREALELHGVEMEKAFIFGIPTEEVGENGYPERTTGGLIWFLRNYVPTNVNDFSLNSTYSGKAWTDVGGGKAWLDAYLEQLFRFGASEKLVLAGSGAVLGLQQLVEAFGHMTITPTTAAYGIKVGEWITPFGTLYIKTHPLMSQEVTTRYSMFILEPKNMKYRYISDTEFYGEGEAKQSSKGNNGNRKDSTDEEYLTECGLEFWWPDVFMYLNGFGLDSVV
jgi:hypothetical protein